MRQPRVVFGYSADEMIGSSILKLIPEDLHSDEKTIMENIRAGRRVEHFETVRRTKSGQLLDVSLTVSPIRDEHGRVIGASKILRDISARKRLEQALLQAEKIAATGRMAATIAHEINNPLEAVMNLMYLLRPMIADPAGISYFQSVETELGRVSHIAKQTLGYYREHAAASSASIGEIVLHAITIYEPRCTATGIEIKKAINSSRKIVLRRGEMMQVVSNLMMNSIYAMQAGGVLSISVEDAAESPDGIVLTIQDDGVGIAEADLPRVFEAFFTTRSTVGTGIGLFVAKQFVEGHGGRIEIESRQNGEDHGTTVRVFLPISTTYDSSGEGGAPRIEWATKCGRSSRFCLKHCCPRLTHRVLIASLDCFCCEFRYRQCCVSERDTNGAVPSQRGSFLPEPNSQRIQPTASLPAGTTQQLRASRE